MSVVAETAGERAWRMLRAQVLDGTLAAGAMVLEGELAASLGVSRTPVRQALVRLADEGLIEIRPRHGMRVRPISAEDMAEIYELLVALEASAARRCAERGLSPERLEGLDAAVASMEAAVAGGDPRAWAEADATFHRRLLEAGGNRRMVSIVAGVSDLVQRARMATLKPRPAPPASNDDHRELVDAIRTRDPDRAEAVHRLHRRRVGALLVGLLADLPGGGA